MNIAKEVFEWIILKDIFSKILYAVILALLFLAPLERLDVAKLLPVEAVAIYLEEGEVVLETDSEDQGRGDTVQAALENLKQNATKIIYLDTARYLLVAENAQAQAQELLQYLKPSVQQGIYAGGDVKEEAKYLDAHSESAKPNANN